MYLSLHAQSIVSLISSAPLQSLSVFQFPPTVYVALPVPSSLPGNLVLWSWTTQTFYYAAFVLPCSRTALSFLLSIHFPVSFVVFHWLIVFPKQKRTLHNNSTIYTYTSIIYICTIIHFEPNPPFCFVQLHIHWLFYWVPCTLFPASPGTSCTPWERDTPHASLKLEICTDRYTNYELYMHTCNILYVPIHIV